MLNWLVHDRGIEPHIPVFDKSQRTDGTLSREDLTYDHANDIYRCPAAKVLQHHRRRFTTARTGLAEDNPLRYWAGTPWFPHATRDRDHVAPAVRQRTQS